MLRPCKYCNNMFECKDFRRKTCGCWRIRKSINKDKIFQTYRGNLQHQFLNAKYQYFRLYHDEALVYDLSGKTDYFYLRPCVEDIPFRF